MKHSVLWNDRPSLFQYLGTYVIAVLALYGLYRLQLFLGLSPRIWVGKLHFQNFMMDWHRQSYLLIAAMIDFLMFIIVVMAGFKFLQSLFSRYTVVDDQLIVHLLTPMGMLQERLELYRIVDYELDQSFLGMIFQFGDVILRSNDQGRPRVVLSGFRKGKLFLDVLREETERCRQLKGVREITMPVPGVK
ncbi:MAG: hypothetical protein K0R66_256 [Gammaproteobacteria bacterium]|jgi:hypothetical protein|nr:hypothetical protein [Gammaproteobacteria bacterium]